MFENCLSSSLVLVEINIFEIRCLGSFPKCEDFEKGWKRVNSKYSAQTEVTGPSLGKVAHNSGRHLDTRIEKRTWLSRTSNNSFNINKIAT